MRILVADGLNRFLWSTPDDYAAPTLGFAGPEIRLPPGMKMEADRQGRSYLIPRARTHRQGSASGGSVLKMVQDGLNRFSVICEFVTCYSLTKIYITDVIGGSDGRRSILDAALSHPNGGVSIFLSVGAVQHIEWLRQTMRTLEKRYGEGKISIFVVRQEGTGLWHSKLRLSLAFDGRHRVLIITESSASASNQGSYLADWFDDGKSSSGVSSETATQIVVPFDSHASAEALTNLFGDIANVAAANCLSPLVWGLSSKERVLLPTFKEATEARKVETSESYARRAEAINAEKRYMAGWYESEPRGSGPVATEAAIYSLPSAPMATLELDDVDLPDSELPSSAMDTLTSQRRKAAIAARSLHKGRVIN